MHKFMQGCCLKKVTDLTMIYFILPKQPTNLQASFRIVQSVKRQASDRNVVGSIPAQTTVFSGFLISFPKKKYVRAFLQPESNNQPVTIFSTGRSEKNKNQDSCFKTCFCIRKRPFVYHGAAQRCGGSVGAIRWDGQAEFSSLYNKVPR